MRVTGVKKESLILGVEERLVKVAFWESLSVFEIVKRRLDPTLAKD